MPQQVLQETDANYIGLNSRLDPSNLQPGFAQEAYNVRLQRGTAQPRKGCKRLTDNTMNSEFMVGSGTFTDANGQDNIVLVYKDGIQLYNTETTAVGSKILFPTGRDIDEGGVVDVVQALDKLYIFRGQETEPRKGTGGTDVLAGCNLTHPAISAGVQGTVTATMANGYSHNYLVGNEVTIFNILAPSDHIALNNSYIVTQVTGTTSFQFTVIPVANLSAATTQNPIHACCVRVKPPLIWNGASTIYVAPQTSIIDNAQGTQASGSIPPSDFGFYFQNRLVCKVSDDRLVVSDIFSELFDFQINNFKINQGGNDAIVGVLPWIESQFLVFMKRSIWIAYVETTSYGSTGDASPGANSSVTIVTTQVGCLSRRSIVAAGQFVFFLSGKGVHVLTPQLDLKLLGNTMPLSEPIDNFFDNVNYAAASKTVASYYDNRFFIALPTGSETRPNAVLVYNTLNQNWESIDTYPVTTAGSLYIDGYAVCQYGNQRRQFILTNFWGLTKFGGIFLTEEYPNTQVSAYGDQFNTSLGTPVLPFTLPATLNSNAPYLFPINARIRSRQYTFDNTNQKRFSRGEYQFNNSPGDVVWIVARTHDPDIQETVMKYAFSGSNTGDSTLRPRIALRGACMDMEVQFKTGRPALKSGTIYAIVANRNMVSNE